MVSSQRGLDPKKNRAREGFSWIASSSLTTTLCFGRR